MDGKHADVQFPLAGIDVSAAFDQQMTKATPVGISKTTVSGENVRAAECLTGRLRGGSRAGVAKYLTGRAGGTAGEIQGLDFVVSQSYDALLAAGEGGGANADEDGGVPWVDDWSTSHGQSNQLGPGVGHTGPEGLNGNNPGTPGGTGTPGPRRPTPPPGTVRRIRPGGSGVWFSRRRPVPVFRLTIIAADETKNVGTVFTWTGDEFTDTGLQ